MNHITHARHVRQGCFSLNIGGGNFTLELTLHLGFGGFRWLEAVIVKGWKGRDGDSSRSVDRSLDEKYIIYVSLLLF